MKNPCFFKKMERKIRLQQPTAKKDERSRGTGRTMPLMDSSFGVRLRGFQFPSNFPGPNSTVEEARDYLLGPKTYSHRGYRARITASHGLNHNSHH